MVELAQQGAPPGVLVDRGADMAVEIAIRALRLAERPMDVDREGRGFDAVQCADMSRR
jgi:hypothetical protein